MICSYLIFPFPIVIIHNFFCLEKKKVDLFFCRRFVCKSAGTQLFYENTASALIATSLLLLQATEHRHRRRPAARGLCEERLGPRALAYLGWAVPGGWGAGNQTFHWEGTRSPAAGGARGGSSQSHASRSAF